MIPPTDSPPSQGLEPSEPDAESPLPEPPEGAEIPPLIYLTMSTRVIVLFDLRREIPVEVIAEFPFLEDAEVELVSNLPAPKWLAERALRVVRDIYVWPDFRVTDQFRTPFPDPFPNGLPTDMDMAAILHRFFRGVDGENLNLTDVYLIDLGILLRLLLERRFPEPDGRDRLGVGVLDSQGRLLEVHLSAHAPTELPSPSETIHRALAVTGAYRFFTWTLAPEGFKPGGPALIDGKFVYRAGDPIPRELVQWLQDLREQTGATHMDHVVILAGDEPPISLQHRVSRERVWGPPDSNKAPF